MIILNDLKWPTFEKRRKVTRLTTMFKVVSSLSAIQVRPCKLFKRRQAGALGNSTLRHSFKLMLKKNKY